MASNYPSGLDEFDPLTPGPSGSKQSQIIGGRSHAEHHNDLGDAVEAIQAELGTDPAGSESTVKARIAAAETALAGKANSTHSHSQSDVTGLTAALADVDTRVPMPAVGQWLANGSYVGNSVTIGSGSQIFFPSHSTEFSRSTYSRFES